MTVAYVKVVLAALSWELGLEPELDDGSLKTKVRRNLGDDTLANR